MSQSVTIDDRQFALFVRRLQELRRVEPAKIVRNIGRDYARAAAKRTRMAKKTEWRAYEVKKTGKIQYVRKLPARYPKGRGFARFAWFLALNNLGVSTKTNKTRLANDAKTNGIFQFHDSDGNSELVAGNKTPYIAKLDSYDGIDYAGRERAMFILKKSISKLENDIAKTSK